VKGRTGQGGGENHLSVIWTYVRRRGDSSQKTKINSTRAWRETGGRGEVKKESGAFRGKEGRGLSIRFVPCLMWGRKKDRQVEFFVERKKRGSVDDALGRL